MGKLPTLDNMYFVPNRGTSVLSPFSFIKLQVNQELVSDKEEVTEEGNAAGEIELGLIREALKEDENGAKGEELNSEK